MNPSMFTILWSQYAMVIPNAGPRSHLSDFWDNMTLKTINQSDDLMWPTPGEPKWTHDPIRQSTSLYIQVKVQLLPEVN